MNFNKYIQINSKAPMGGSDSGNVAILHVGFTRIFVPKQRRLCHHSKHLCSAFLFLLFRCQSLQGGTIHLFVVRRALRDRLYNLLCDIVDVLIYIKV